MDGRDCNLVNTWQGLPLCRSYVLVHFATQPLRVRLEGTTRSCFVTWALGALGCDEQEVLGAWPHSTAKGLNWQAVFDDLAVRGIEKVSFVVHEGVGVAQAAIPPRSPELNSAMFASAQRGVPPSSPRLQRTADSAAAAVQKMRAGLARLIQRHRGLEGPHAALPFLHAALGRLEGRPLANRPRGHDPQRQRAIVAMRH